jgi:hypothetical protein
LPLAGTVLFDPARPVERIELFHKKISLYTNGVFPLEVDLSGVTFPNDERSAHPLMANITI